MYLLFSKLKILNKNDKQIYDIVTQASFKQGDNLLNKASDKQEPLRLLKYVKYK